MSSDTAKPQPRASDAAADAVIVITAADLPLHCPGDKTPLWSSHPRVFIAIEEAANQEASCPYCGAHYRLV